MSFTTNTNWQSYTGESTVSNFTQMVGLAVHNFTLRRHRYGHRHRPGPRAGAAQRQPIGNFWADAVRVTLYLLLPHFAAAGPRPDVAGCAQTLAGTAGATTSKGADQTLTYGPMGSQEAIKELGTNGGGFLNANSAHPFEGPTPASPPSSRSACIFLIPSALALSFGHMVGDVRQGWACGAPWPPCS